MPTTPPPGRTDTQQILDGLHQRLIDQVGTLETGEQWQAWLAFAAGFHRYSFNNVMLIWSQMPTASLVAGYRTWLEKGRQVRKGEHALRVLAPSIRSEPAIGTDGRPVLEPDGSPRRRHRIVGYRPVPVFDISQTDGPPPPDPVRPALLEGAAPAGLWDALVDEALQRGYRLTRRSVAELGGANGRTYFDRREIWIRHDVDDAQAVKTLAHELGHVLLHGDVAATVPCEGIREVEAESVAYLLTACHGMATDNYSFPYVAAWAHTVADSENTPLTTVVARTGTRVMQASLLLIDATADPAAPEPTVEAVRERAERHVERTEIMRDQAAIVAAQAHTAGEDDTLRAVLADTQQYFRHALARSWVPRYLEQRGLDGAITSHGLGYAPAGWTALVDHLARLGYRDDHLAAAGIATRTRRGTLIDRFRDRLTIPAHDERGRLSGFVARSSPDQVEDAYHPRYLNTPNTPLYVKGNILMGLHRLNPPLEVTVVLCEGPLDAIAVDIAAQEQARPYVGIATAGTAFTEHQADRLAAAIGTQPVCLAFDSDPAGEQATEAAWRTLTDHTARTVTVAVLPSGADPADVIAQRQSGQLIGAIDTARPAAEHICDVKIERSGVEDHCVRRLAAFRTLIDYLPRIPATERDQFVTHLAHRLRIEPDVVETALHEHQEGLEAREAFRIKGAWAARTDQPAAMASSTDPRLQPSESSADAAVRGVTTATGTR